MKKLLFSALMMLFVGGVFAQNTPEQQARQISDMLTKKLELTQDESQQVYEIYLNHNQKMEEMASLKSTNTDLFMKKYEALERETSTAFTAAVGPKVEAYKEKAKAQRAERIQSSGKTQKQ